MNLKKPLYAILSLLMLMSIAISSCKGKNEVALVNDSIVVEDSFKKSNGELCKIKTKVVVSYPNEYKDNENLQKLKVLFCKEVLNSPDGVSDIKSALNLYAKSIITDNSPLQIAEDSVYSEEDYDDIDIDNFEITIRITNVYNKNDLLTFCCEKTVKKNDKVTSVSHSYVNLDLVLMKKLTLSDLFLNESMDQITQMLKSKLIENVKVNNEDELYNSGYYNLQNIVISDNFYFCDDGITWCYEPGIISLPSMGETSLTLPFEELMRFKCKDSALNRI
ncbi:MAG: DUF3298 domain-containing protein [Muribaculaceae bacterium]|nr:DUF3298 domain-containing protein [Muribaculaceae bacterium]